MSEQRLIDANALPRKTVILRRRSYLDGRKYVSENRLAVLAEDIDRAPTIDAVPVVHGRWMYGEDVDLVCSVCGKDALSDWTCQQICTDYCPHCGAKMKRGATDV